MTRPAQAALLPALAERPEELTAANGLSAIFEGAGVLAGPLGAAALLAFASPAAVFLAAAGCWGRRAPGREGSSEYTKERMQSGLDGAIVSGSTFAGFRLLARQREPRLLVGLLVGSDGPHRRARRVSSC